MPGTPLGRVLDGESDGVAMVPDPIHGRRVVFARDFKKGEIVFWERPLLCFESGERWAASLASAYVGATPEVQLATMECFAPPLDSPEPAIALLGRIASALEQVPGLNMTQQECHRLLLVSDFNCHAYRGGKAERGETADLAESSPLALFEVASKIEHSCHPNLQTETSSGSLVAVAARDVREGDYASCSYLGPALEMARDERQAKLQKDKLFTCDCPRCNSPDLPLVACEAELMTALKGQWPDDSASLSCCLALVAAAARRGLPPSHQFYPRCYDKIAQLATADARRLATPAGRAERRLQAARAQLEIVAWKNTMQQALDDREIAATATAAAKAVTLAAVAMTAAATTTDTATATATATTAAAALTAAAAATAAATDTATDTATAAAAMLLDDDDAVNDTSKKKKKKKKKSTQDDDASSSAECARRRVDEVCSSTETCQASIKDAFFAASDFLKAGHSDLAAPIFRAYAPLLETWLRPDDPDKRLIAAVLAKHPS